MHPTDEQLVANYVMRGDDRAFRMLVERHQERIYGYLVGMVHDEDVANDLFQETFLRVIHALHRRRGKYQNQGRFLAWILKIARNAALDHLRSRKKWVDVGGDGADDSSMWDLLPDASPDALETAELREEVDLLEASIDRLPPEQREVLLLRHEAELTFREIAELTGCSINTALGRMRYALTNLRRYMAQHDPKKMIHAG